MRAASAARHPTEQAMLLMAAGMVLVPALDAIAKVLSAELTPAQIAWGRFAFQLLVMLPFVLARPAAVRREDLLAHAARGVLLGVATVCFFSALAVMPLADAIAIFFVEPLLLSLMAGLVLREGIGWRRLAAIGVGFAGALLIVQPSFRAFGAAALLPLAAAFCFASYLLLTRRLGARYDAVTLQATAGLGGLVTLSLVLLAGATLGFEQVAWRPVDGGAWALLFVLGLTAAVAHLLVVQAFRLASAVILAPFQYLEILAAVFWGQVIFGDWPDPLTWLGIAVITASGLYVFYRERRRALAT